MIRVYKFVLDANDRGRKIIIRDTLRAPLCATLFEFSVLAAGYNGINHYRGEQVQPLNRDRWKPVTGAVSKPRFFSSSVQRGKLSFSFFSVRVIRLINKARYNKPIPIFTTRISLS